MQRLFAALEIPREVALSLSLLRGGLPGARWIDAENYHITLRFFGDIENHLADEIVHAFDRIEREPFKLRLEGIDVFGSKKPHSLFARITPCEELLLLQAEMERIAKRYGLPADKSKYTPHVTIARLRHVKLFDLVPYLSSRGNFASDYFNVHRFVIMSSKLSVGGGPYIVEESYALRSKQAVLL